MIINGSSSSWSPVVSGLPQGTVLGPILFLMFINDLPTNTASGIKLFAEDCVLYRPINSVSDHFALHQDFNQLEKWAYTWQMKFSPTKCFVMSIPLKNCPSQFSYSLCDAQLDGACHQKHLGIHMTFMLRWQLQCDTAKKKPISVLGILQRNLSSCDRSVKASSYLSLVRPIVEYATVAWSPHTNKGIGCIESIQCRAACFVNSDYSHYSSVSSMLTDLNWPSLQSSAGYVISACFIRYVEVKSTPPFLMTLPPCLRMAVQGRVTTLIRLPS